MSNALDKALNDTTRSYASAKQAVASTDVASIMAGGPTGLMSRPSLGQHKQQYDANSGWSYVAVSAIAKRIASREMFVAKAGSRPKLGRSKTVGEGLEPLGSHALIDAVDDPNSIMTRWSLLYVTICSLELTGKSYLWMRRNGERIEFWPLPSHWVTPVHGNGLFSGWSVQPDGCVEPFLLDGSDVAYISLPDPKNPILGSLSPLQSQAKAINADDGIQVAQQQAFENGIFPVHILHLAKDANGRRLGLTGTQDRQVVSALKRRYVGAHKAGEPFVVGWPIESIDKMSRIPAEMDFLRSGQATKSRIMEAFGVNPLIVGEIEGANRAQAVVAEQIFASNVINPLLDLLGQVFTSKVAPAFAGNERLVVWFDPVVPLDHEMQLKRWEVGMKHGVVTPNEFRVHVLNLPEDNQFDGQLVGGRT